MTAPGHVPTCRTARLLLLDRSGATASQQAPWEPTEEQLHELRDGCWLPAAAIATTCSCPPYGTCVVVTTCGLP